MNKLIYILISILATLFAFKIYAAERTFQYRDMELAGIVVDSQSLSPIEKVSIFDNNNKKIGETDSKGYFRVKFPVNETGEVLFKLKLEKKGYESFIQNDHWGNYDNPSGSFYFGMKKDNTESTGFSKITGKGLNYAGIKAGLDHLKAGRAMQDIINSAKNGNENLILTINGEKYLVTNFNYFKLGSKDKYIMVNDIIQPIDGLNKTLKRSNIKNLSRLGGKKAQFDLTTF
ncbi:hypothetical protein BAZ12_12370 [Elizabethkingia miricola]|uniref:Carboxypeptidase regulatory-like domain-containing protein n=1 Tax=Elizabethkingia miricola TaxID=172045 RepID=A0ABD4DQG0_ELIMR|nr:MULTISPECIES: hypothetical protein [Elizabethkingia]KUG12093.1 hypothetical protein AMC91_11065 [Elizabethkingia miricola]KUY20740.1 hypothetical protein ATB95_07510 [Elizabethkingia miricola]MCL1653062.1 hypothetical protein [Elizabethkingia miricola]MCL1655157.1 hypothetical protein [Elizabethkingia miricola]MCP1252056.1 hypothetical protein [Elizabethkingia sp. S0634]